MIKFLNYKFLLLLGLAIIIYFIYRDVEDLKYKINAIEKGILNPLKQNQFNIQKNNLKIPIPKKIDNKIDNNLNLIERKTNEIINNSCSLSDSQESQIIYNNGNVEIYSNDVGENESTNSILNSAKNHMNDNNSKKKIILVKNEQDPKSNVMIKYTNDDNPKDQEIAIEDDIINGIVDDYPNQNKIINSQKFIFTGNEVVSADEEVVSSDEEVVSADEEVISADEEVISADEEVISADEEVISADEEVVSADEEVVSADEEVVSADEEVVSADEEVADEEVADDVVADDVVADDVVAYDVVADEVISANDDFLSENNKKLNETLDDNNGNNTFNKNNILTMKSSDDSTVTEDENDSDDHLPLKNSISKKIIDISINDIVFKKNIKIDEKTLYSKLLRKKLLELQSKAQDKGINISKIVNGKTKKKKKAELVEELILLEKNI